MKRGAPSSARSFLASCGEPESLPLPGFETQGGAGGQSPHALEIDQGKECECEIGSVWKASYGRCPFVGECLEFAQFSYKKRLLASQRAGGVTPARFASI